MSNIQTGAPRTPHDLSHFVYSTGENGRLKVLSTTNVIAGDSYQLDAVGAYRLSPLRRGLAVDTNVEIYTFYIPYRHVYGEKWIDFMKKGVKGGVELPFDQFPDDDYYTEFLGTHLPRNNRLPKYMAQGYFNIYNNYFKYPAHPDKGYDDLSHPSNRTDGFACCRLKNLWSAPLPDETIFKREMNIEGGNLDIMDLQSAYAKLHTEQERVFFMQRYRDVISSFGGKTKYDADNRPLLLMRSKFWASGYDVDGTDQSSLGQFSGRVQQTFQHQVPRFFVPEHGIIMTLCLSRFPTIMQWESNYLMNRASPSYLDIAGDPTLVGNLPPRKIKANELFRTNYSYDINVPEGQWYRYQASHVDGRYAKVDSFPFIQIPPENINQCIYYDAGNDNKLFQTTQLGHWNMQSKFNVTVYRRLPTARDSIMTS